MPKETAKKVAKDLLKLNAVEKENDVLNQTIDLLNQKIALKDTVISLKDNKIGDYQRITADHESKDKITDSILKKNQRTLKWMRFQRSGLGIIVIAVTTLFLLKK